jgi:hypothetical protein
MEKLEILEQFKKQYGSQINPDLLSLKYSQTKQGAYLEMTLQDNPMPIIINLKFIGDEFIQDEDRNDIEMLPMFDPEADIVDNAKSLIELDSYSLINCFENLFTKEAANEINNKYLSENWHLNAHLQ